MRDRLIELLKSPHKAEQLRQMGVTIGKYEDDCVEAMIADFLLASGVIVPPCKVGDKVYRIWSVGKHGKSTAEFVVTKVSQIMDKIWVIRYQKQAKNLYSTPTIYQCNFNDIGKTVFLTREEAEKAIEERREE